MSLLERVTEYVANQTSPLAPLTLTLPLASVHPVSRLISHLTSTPVHALYFPFVRFGVIHAARVTTVWAGLTKGKDRRDVGLLQDLFGYLTMAWGGGTLVSLLLHQPPSWLLSPTPWLIYPTAYLLLVPTRLSEYIVTTAPSLPLNLVGAYIDGMTRGVTITSLPDALTLSGVKGTSWFTPIILSGLAVSGGGWAVQLLGMHEKEWGMGVPGVLRGGILNTLDLWGGMLVGVVYAALMRTHPEFSALSHFTASVLPDDLQVKGSKASPMVTQETARAICVLLLGSLLAARAITLSLLSSKPAKATPKSRAKKVKATPETASIEKEKEKAEVVKSSTKRERAATPRKSPRPSKKVQ